jgi:hypothetical protein
VNVRFDVYGETAADLEAHAAGVLADFGPHLVWTWDTDAEALHSPEGGIVTYRGHVTAESTPT